MIILITSLIYCFRNKIYESFEIVYHTKPEENRQEDIHPESPKHVINPEPDEIPEPVP